MKSAISEEQIESYRQNGFIAIRDFLDPDELKTWKRVTEDAVQQRLSKAKAPARRMSKKDEYYNKVFVQCLRLADTHEGMAELMYDPRLGEVAATLAGVDGIRIWHDQSLYKEPYGNPTAWHLDNPYWSFYSRDAISIWVALDDATLENGALWYLPGTHLTARFDNAPISANMSGLFKLYPEWKKMEAVPAPAPAGTAVFHNGLTAHAAGANMTPRPRRAMTCAYMPDGATFNGHQSVLPKEYFESLEVGDVLENDKQNPLIWHKEKKPTPA